MPKQLSKLAYRLASSFTGSTKAGAHIASICSGQVKPCSMELGGNAASIVLDDMPVEAVLPGLLGTSVMLNNGEACIAQSRIMVPEASLEQFVGALGPAASQLVVGDPFEATTMIGPMVTEKHRQLMLDYIGIGKSEGATLVSGGGIPDSLPNGWYLQPTVFAGVTPDMRIAKEEIFGPVIKIMSYKNEDDAVALANNQPFGLSSSVWSADGERAAKLAQRIDAGAVYVNGAMGIDPNAPFGGFKRSGLGKECGPEGLNEYLDQKTIYTPLAVA